MLLHFLYPLHVDFSFFNVFRYITFRTFGAGITAVLICILLGPSFIRWLKSRQIGQEVRSDGPKSHLSKQGTPTMGGTLIIISIVISTLLWGDLSNHNVWVAMLVTVLFGVVGYADDSLKVIHKKPDGLSARGKLLFQILIGGAAAVFLYVNRDNPTTLKIPFAKDFAPELGLLFIPFAILVIVGASNAVNLTDGLDGLAIGPVMTTSATFLILAYCAGHSKFSEYLGITYVPGSAELAVFLASVAAACLGFLWWNTYPAQVFMGDVGSLSLGAALGVVAVITKNEILLAICGGVFVLETLSVMVQVISFKTTGKRMFRMAPIHHHFELKGWAEPKVIVRFWIISILLALVTLSTLKLR